MLLILKKSLYERERRRKNKDYINANRRKKYREDPEYRARIKKEHHETYIRHKEKRLSKNREWALANPESVRAIKHKYQDSHREILRKKNRFYSHTHKEERKQYRKMHRDRHKQYMHEYYLKNRTKHKEKNNIYRIENADIIRIRQKAYRNKHKKELYDQYTRELKENPQRRIAHYLRCRLGKVLRLYTRTGKIQSSRKYGIEYKAIIEHLKPFPEDMSKYHIDHIRPLRSFDLNDPEQVKQAFAPENHQWLLAEDNLHKNSMFNGVMLRRKRISREN